MKKDEMKEKVLKYIEQNDHVSYAELEWLFEQNDYDYKGNLDALSEKCEHVVFGQAGRKRHMTCWANLSAKERRIGSQRRFSPI